MILILLLYALTTLPAKSAYNGPLFDAHSHLLPSRDQESEETVRGERGRTRRKGSTNAPTVVERLDRKGLAGVFLFGASASTTEESARRPEFVYAYAEIVRNVRTGKLELTVEALATLERQLGTGHFYGIGEIPLRHSPTKRNPGGDAYPADDSRVLRIYDLAANFDVPVNVHVEYEYASELERALSHSRGTIIIWAHMGDAPAELVGSLMRRHPNLYADISCRNPYYERNRTLDEQSLTDGTGRLKKEWRDLFEEFPDRFLFGLDLGAPARYGVLDEVISYSRNVLGQLTTSTADKIARENAMKLVGRRNTAGGKKAP